MGTVTKHFWLVADLPLWKMMDFVSWDDFPFPTEWKVIIHSMVPVTTNHMSKGKLRGWLNHPLWPTPCVHPPDFTLGLVVLLRLPLQLLQPRWQKHFAATSAAGPKQRSAATGHFQWPCCILKKWDLLLISYDWTMNKHMKCISGIHMET